MRKRSVMALAAGALLAAMLPGVATAQGSTSADVTTLSTLTPDFGWDGRLAGNPTNDYVWDGRLASDVTRDYVWDRRLASGPTLDYAWDGRLAGSPSLALVLAN